VTKEQAPNRKHDTLYARIEYLASIGKLTASLKEWAHALRALGNNALHDEQDIAGEEAVQAHNLTRFILIYLYTLPKQIELSRTIQ